jgi:predicted nucleic acid-binding protein
MSSQYIVDASVMVQLLVTESYTAEARALFATIDEGNKLVLPEFGLMECTNVLWKHVRFHGLRPADAEKQIQTLIALDVMVVPVIGLIPRALEIGLAHQLAIYDSVYIALAEKLGHALITVDQKQANAAQAEGVSLKAITDFTPGGD